MYLPVILQPGICPDNEVNVLDGERKERSRSMTTRSKQPFSRQSRLSTANKKADPKSGRCTRTKPAQPQGCTNGAWSGVGLDKPETQEASVDLFYKVTPSHVWMSPAMYFAVANAEHKPADSRTSPGSSTSTAKAGKAQINFAIEHPHASAM